MKKIENNIRQKQNFEFSSSYKNYRGRYTDFIVGNEKTDYHREAKTLSSIVFKYNNLKVKKVLMYLPTVKKQEYNRIYRDLDDKIGEKYNLLKDGRPNSNSIKEVYTPHIISKKVDSNGEVISLLDIVNNYYNIISEKI
jgi:hypothetical protein